MPNKNILTYGAKISNVERVYYSPVVTVPPSNQALSSMYVFLSRVLPWPDENNPPIPEQTQKYLKSVSSNMFVAKTITPNNISPVIQRIDWTSVIIYDYYRDDVNMFEVDSNGFLIRKFYVKNQYNQVFKCLWNNNGAPSTNEPYFEPGTYGTNNIFQGADNYKWKYIFTISTGSIIKFMDSAWIPVPVGANTPNPFVTSSGRGSIDVINLTNAGSGYDPSNTQITIQIIGDGTGASANVLPTVNGTGALSDIIVSNPGTNYTYANVIITSSTGSNAVAIAPTSPIGGHGFDPISELGCSRVMLTCEFNGNELTNGIEYLPTDINYYQAGIMVNPTSLSSSPLLATSSIYRLSTDVIVAPGLGVYLIDELVYQGSSLETATFIGTLLSFNEATNTLKIINTKGTLNNNAPIVGNISKTVRTVLSHNLPDFSAFSGYISYIENRSGVQRSYDGIEQFKIVLGY